MNDEQQTNDNQETNNASEETKLNKQCFDFYSKNVGNYYYYSTIINFKNELLTKYKFYYSFQEYVKLFSWNKKCKNYIEMIKTQNKNYDNDLYIAFIKLFYPKFSIDNLTYKYCEFIKKAVSQINMTKFSDNDHANLLEMIDNNYNELLNIHPPAIKPMIGQSIEINIENKVD
tara:strand:- start:4780 stop:5298 length:519 start_codon:yes stop_codon:yes gene_type:complete